MVNHKALTINIELSKVGIQVFSYSLIRHH